jgi:hypothetical protein
MADGEAGQKGIHRIEVKRVYGSFKSDVEKVKMVGINTKGRYVSL